MADLISVRKVTTDSQIQMCCVSLEKKKHSRLELKRICKLIRPSYKCSYKIVKARIDQKKVLNNERFRWIRRVKFILDDVSGVYVYDAHGHGKVSVADVSNSNFQEILDYDSDEIDEDVCVESIIDDDGDGDEKDGTKEDKELIKDFSSTSIGGNINYLKIKSNMEENSLVSKMNVEKLEDDTNRFSAVEEDIELLMTKYFQKIDM